MVRVKLPGLLKEIWIALKYVLDPKVPFSKKIWIIFAILYLISPLDVFPDPIFGIGAIDDVVIILLILFSLANRLAKYDENKKIYDNKSPKKESATIDVDYEIVNERKE
jgi:uncharacterized membrane protein YkvA (DUF1232 family)